MSLSITINNINDLTDAERAVLRYVLDGVPMTDELRERRVPPADGGVAATKKYLELIGHTPVAAPADGGYLIPIVSEAGRQFAEALDAGKSFEGAHGTFTPVPPATPVPASAELDSAGLPWDKRIHSSSRAKVADGTWRKMRGVDDALVATVEAELRAVQAIPVPVATVQLPHNAEDVALLESASHEVTEVVRAAVPLPPSASVPSAYNQGVDDPADTTAAVSPHLSAPTVTLAEMQAKLNAVEELPQHPVPVPPAAPLTFADLMKHVTPMLVSGKLPQDTLLAVTAEFGLPHLAALGARPDLVEAVRARIDEVVG